MVYAERMMLGILVHTCESNRYLKSIADDILTSCDEIIDMVAKSWQLETVSINSNHKKATYEIGYYVLYSILFVTIVLLEIAIFLYYFIKHWSKRRKNTLPY